MEVITTLAPPMGHLHQELKNITNNSKACWQPAHTVSSQYFKGTVLEFGHMYTGKFGLLNESANHYIKWQILELVFEILAGNKWYTVGRTN